jgi:hypothetical protein
MMGATLKIQATTWAVAKQRFDEARAAEVSYDRVSWRPAYEASKHLGPPIPEHVDAVMEQLMEARHDAEDALIATPAPELADAVWKIDYARKRWAQVEGWPEDWWEAILADLHALVAETGADHVCV